MRHIATVSLLACLLGSPTLLAGWTDDKGQALPDTPHMRSAGDFGAQLVFTEDLEQFREIWNVSVTPPRLPTVQRVKRGGTISGMVIFYGCKAGGDRQCNLFAEFSVQLPDGKRVSAGGASLWTIAPVADQLMLGDTSLDMRLGANDIPGVYRIEVTVIDRVSGLRLPLSRSFTLD
ncbi:MAG: hypothetical protein REI94_08330 [Moraxellaceae bacterium]|nr:hypothetical protein [Moraxellaceae bacterium]